MGKGWAKHISGKKVTSNGHVALLYSHQDVRAYQLKHQLTGRPYLMNPEGSLINLKNQVTFSFDKGLIYKFKSKHNH